MLRHALLLTVPSLFLLGCASSRTLELVHDEAIDARAIVASTEAPAPELAREPEVVALSFADYELEVLSVGAEPREPVLTLAQDESLHGSRFTLKGGYYGADEDALDDGYIFNVSWMRFFTKIFAIEFEAGYLDVDGSEGTVDAEVWSVPIMLNGRFNLPVWVLDVYAGLGIGTFYYDVELSGGATGDDDGFLAAGNGFLGATINLADAIALGLEGKYYVTEDIDDADAALDAYAIMLTLGFSR